MSEVDFVSQVSSEDESLGVDKVVPVGEAIRYRKRAQSAEKQVAVLEAELSAAVEKNRQLNEQVSAGEVERELVNKLIKAGAGDLEAAVLIAKAKLGGDGDIDAVVAQLREEKAYLFGGLARPVASLKTSGVREKGDGAKRVLEDKAKRAAVSGSRADMQEYLRVRRQFV